MWSDFVSALLVCIPLAFSFRLEFGRVSKQLLEECHNVVPGSWLRDSHWRQSLKCKCPVSTFVIGDDEACDTMRLRRYFDSKKLMGKGCRCGPASWATTHTVTTTQFSAIFAYGTLRGDYCEDGDAYGMIRETGAHWTSATVYGYCLYQDVGRRFPFAVRSSNSSCVLHGTLLTWPNGNAQEAIQRCDDIEGFDPQYPDHGHYQRDTVEVLGVSAYIYHQSKKREETVLAEQVERGEILQFQDGDWLLHTTTTTTFMTNYFAYGSNMDIAQMENRIAKHGGTFRRARLARLWNYRLEFSKEISDGVGAANIQRTREKIVYGIVYEMDTAAFEIMDHFEGCWHTQLVPHGYEPAWEGDYYRMDCTVEVLAEDGDDADPDAWQQEEAITYKAHANKVVNGSQPTDDYLGRLLAGEQLLPADYVEELRMIAQRTSLAEEEPAIGIVDPAGFGFDDDMSAMTTDI